MSCLKDYHNLTVGQKIWCYPCSRVLVYTSTYMLDYMYWCTAYTVTKLLLSSDGELSYFPKRWDWRQMHFWRRIIFHNYFIWATRRKHPPRKLTAAFLRSSCLTHARIPWFSDPLSLWSPVQTSNWSINICMTLEQDFLYEFYTFHFLGGVGWILCCWYFGGHMTSLTALMMTKGASNKTNIFLEGFHSLLVLWWHTIFLEQ